MKLLGLTVETGKLMPIFTTRNGTVLSLIEAIDMGNIGLLELQRPFVWPNVNVRNLFASLYRGYGTIATRSITADAVAK